MLGRDECGGLELVELDAAADWCRVQHPSQLVDLELRHVVAVVRQVVRGQRVCDFVGPVAHDQVVVVVAGHTADAVMNAAVGTARNQSPLDEQTLGAPAQCHAHAHGQVVDDRPGSSR